MTLRFEASQQVSTEEYYPLSREAPLPTAVEIHKRNVIPVRLRDSATWNGFEGITNLRSKFFPKYVREDVMARRKDPSTPPASTLATEYSRNQGKIDNFYDGIFRLAEGTITPSFFHDRYRGPQYGIVRSYAHPLDYMGARLKRLRTDKDNGEERIKVAEGLMRISVYFFLKNFLQYSFFKQLNYSIIQVIVSLLLQLLTNTGSD